MKSLSLQLVAVYWAGQNHNRMHISSDTTEQLGLAGLVNTCSIHLNKYKTMQQSGLGFINMKDHIKQMVGGLL